MKGRVFTMGRRITKPQALTVGQIREAVAAGRLLMRRATSETVAAKVIIGLELPRYPIVAAQCTTRGEPLLLKECAEYFSMIAVAAALLGRDAKAKELAALAARLPKPSGNDYFSLRRCREVP